MNPKTRISNRALVRAVAPFYARTESQAKADAIIRAHESIKFPADVYANEKERRACRYCGKRHVAQIDHTIPIVWFRLAHSAGIVMNDSHNACGLCYVCHAAKTDREISRGKLIDAAIAAANPKRAIALMKDFATRERNRIVRFSIAKFNANSVSNVELTKAESERRIFLAAFNIAAQGRGNKGSARERIDALPIQIERAGMPKLESRLSSETWSEIRAVYKNLGRLRPCLDRLSENVYMARRVTNENHAAFKAAIKNRCAHVIALNVARVTLAQWALVATPQIAILWETYELNKRIVMPRKDKRR